MREIRRRFKYCFSYRSDEYVAQAHDIETTVVRKKTREWSSDVILIDKGWRYCGTDIRYIDFLESQYYDQSKIHMHDEKLPVYRFEQRGSSLPTAIDTTVITSISESVFDCESEQLKANAYQVSAAVVRSLKDCVDEKMMVLFSLPQHSFDLLVEPIRYNRSDLA